MNEFISKIINTSSPKEALELLYNNIEKTSLIQEAYNEANIFHKKINRKSGEPYIIHPILVAALVANLEGTEDMVCSALLHDVVEDSECSIEEIGIKFNQNIAILVDGLTKINDDEKKYTSALSFGKLLDSSKKNHEVLIIKLCDRVHNMLTLDALDEKKKIRISKESLQIYSGIAHKMGINVIKNLLEDLSFKYIQPTNYQKIKDYIDTHQQDLHLKLNNFITTVTKIMFQYGFKKDDFFIDKRIKHLYSIEQKTKRKAISIDEVTDLLAIRIMVQEKIDCYKVLGALHIEMEPLVSRFKDYIANPKENGYQTLHTMFFFNGTIIEAQVRTESMHQIAEHGIAAHWKYKGKDVKIPNMSWIDDIDYHNKVDKDIVLNEYDIAKESIFEKNEITVYSKDGERFNMPDGSKVLDFAYLIHTEVGERADKAYINETQVNLLTPLKNGNVIEIVLGKTPHYRCSWIEDLKTSKAIRLLKISCRDKLKDIDEKVGRKILREVFGIDRKTMRKWLGDEKISDKNYKVSTDSVYLENVVAYLKKYAKNNFKLFLNKNRFKIEKQKFTNIVVYSNYKFKNVSFDFCCHPKRSDQIIGFRKKDEVVVHHKMCDTAKILMEVDEPMIFVKWTKDTPDIYTIIFTLENRVGALAEFLEDLKKYEINLIDINSHDEYVTRKTIFKATIEKRDSDFKDIKSKIGKHCRIISFTKAEDPYK